MNYVLALDIETTGFGKKDRIIEIGAILFDLEARKVIGQIETLIDPMRNIPEESSEIHSLKSSDLSLAPTFEEIADDLLELLTGKKIVAHNADFDLKFLLQEFARVGRPVDFDNFICTYQLTGQRLNVACEQISFKFEHHSALEDAKATLSIWFDKEVAAGTQIQFGAPIELEQTFRTVTRSQIGLQPIDTRKSVLTNLNVKFSQVGAEKTYLGLLDAYLRDLRITDLEKSGLNEFASDKGISNARLLELQDIYLSSIETAALRDGIITTLESDFFNQIAKTLGSDRKITPSEHPTDLPPVGSLICVTGTATVNGVHYNKETVASFLEKNGFVFTDSISKKSGVALLLQESEGSQSSKVAKAQAWGIPRMVIADFVDLVSS